MGKSTISMANFNSYVKLPEGNPIELWLELIEKPKREIVVMFTNWTLSTGGPTLYQLQYYNWWWR